MINQLRIYRIDPATAGAFHDRFRDHAARIMGRRGFRILAMWEAEGEAEGAPTLDFVYLLAWEHEAEMQARWEDFIADPEWAEIKRATSAEHGAMVLSNAQMTLRPVPYLSLIHI